MDLRRIVALLAVCALVVVAAGCGDDGASESGSKSASSAKQADTDGSKQPDAAAPPKAPPAVEPPPAAPKPTSFRIVVADGVVQGGLKPLRASAGDTVRLTVSSDAADEVHVHGVDKTLDVTPGVPATITFPVKDRGSYEIEMHDSGLVLGMLEVR